MIPATNNSEALPDTAPKIVPDAVRQVVFSPDVLVAALYDPRAREILNSWRDGKIRPVVTRELLVLYLRTLRQAGLTPELVRKWSLWLTAPGKTLYLEREPTAQASGIELCRVVATETGAELIGWRGK